MDVSIIIPVYNSSAYINKCLDSILNESIKNLEVIVINDGSSDNSLELINDYKQKITNLVVIDKINEGQAKARNQALKIAKGEYIFYLDSDDWVEPGSISKLYDEAIKNNADIVIGKSNICYEDGKVEPSVRSFTSEPTDKKYILNETGPCSKLIKKNLIIKNSLYFLENHIYEDIATVPAYILYTDKVVYTDIVVYDYFQRTGSTMRLKEYSTKMEDIFDSMKNIRMLFDNANKSETYKDELEYLYIEHLLHAASLRFFKYDNYKKNIDTIVSIMSETYPNWKQNKYLKQKGFKYTLVCDSFYKKRYLFLKLVLKK